MRLMHVEGTETKAVQKESYTLLINARFLECAELEDRPFTHMLNSYVSNEKKERAVETQD